MATLNEVDDRMHEVIRSDGLCVGFVIRRNNAWFPHGISGKRIETDPFASPDTAAEWLEIHGSPAGHL